MIKIISYGYGKRILNDIMIMKENDTEFIIAKKVNNDVEGKFLKVTIEEIPEEEYYKSI